MKQQINAFKENIEEQYTFEGPSFVLGGAMLEGECLTNNLVRLPLRTMNRHGLIAGATGTGKTKTLQIIAEQLSQEGVPVLLMDIKGDLSGIAAPSEGHPKIDERHEKIGIPFESDASPVEFLSLSEEPGVRLRATVTEFGPVLFSKLLGLNEVQEGITALIFKYCDDHEIPLIDLEDYKKMLLYLSNEGKEDVAREYGRISSSSVGAIMRSLIQLEQQGGADFFGEPSFDVDDLCRVDEDGSGIVSILRLIDLMEQPKLFSTFMLQVLAEVYDRFPEAGDTDKPKLVLCIDEAHLVFKEATDALLDQIKTVVKLIRSKGVGILFITQNPDDIPQEVLGQLGLKVQHALRAFTARDRKAIKRAAENFPESDYYTVDKVLTELGIGEAMITALNEDGRPTPLVRTLLRAPESRMDVLTASEIDRIVNASKLIPKYSESIDRESAREIIEQKIQKMKEAEAIKAQREEDWKKVDRERKREEPSMLEQILDTTTKRQIGRTIARELTRGLMGILGAR